MRKVVLPRKYGTCGELDVADLETREGNEDEHLDSEGFGNEEVSYDDNREREEEDEATEEAAGFDGYKHEVRKRATRDKESSIKVSCDGLVRRTATCGYRREVSARFRWSHGVSADMKQM